MDCDVGSTAFIVPRLGEHISSGLNTLIESFNHIDPHLINDKPICSPIFQPINESSPDDLITFDHQEEVVATNESQLASCIPVFDLENIGQSDLFSFDIDDINPSISPISPLFNSLSSTFQFKPDTDFSDIPLPDNIMDLFDEHVHYDPTVQVPDSTSFSNDSSELQEWNNSVEEGSPYVSDLEFDEDEMEDFVEIKPHTVRKSRRKSLQTNSVVCLHNEDLTHGKPGQRLILTAEERRLLTQMGQRIPTHFPLTRGEERAIRTMRRKIRNKLSAKASRARRQEYVSSLEIKVTNCQKENQKLRSRIRVLEETNDGLVAHLRNARSQINQLLKGTYTRTANGLGLSIKSSQPQPLLPLTIPRQNTTMNQPRTMMKSGKPASLLLVALMILASATVLPLPGLEEHPDGVAAVLKNDLSSKDQSILSGHSRMLLNQEEERIPKMYVENLPRAAQTSDVNSFGTSDDGDEDGIPVIKTKIDIMNRSSKSGPLVLPTFKDEEQFDPFLLPLTSEAANNGKTANMKGAELNTEVYQRSPISYSLGDL